MQRVPKKDGRNENTARHSKHQRWPKDQSIKKGKILSKNTGKDLETIAQDTERDYFMDSNEAFDYGIVDKVLDNEKISE